MMTPALAPVAPFKPKVPARFFLPESLLGDSLNVLVIGAGGTGSHVLSSLAGMAYALSETKGVLLNVCVVDPDEVSPFNVGRQMFYPSDVGQNKAHLIAGRINRAYGFRWRSFAERFEIQSQVSDSRSYDFSQSEALLRQSHLVITCVDNVACRVQVGEHIKRCMTSSEALWLDFGNGDAFGQAVLGCISRTKGQWLLPSVLDKFPELKESNFQEDDAPSCSMVESLERQGLYCNKALSTLGMAILWDLLYKGSITHHATAMNLSTGKSTSWAVP